MKILFAGIVLIAVAGAFILGLVIGKQVGRERDLRTGKINGLNEVMTSLIKSFPDRIRETEYKDAEEIFTVKASTAYTINVNGVKTIKVAY